MAEFTADVRDIKFVLFDQLDIDALLSSSKYSQYSREDFEMILDEAYKLAKEVVAPANEPADREGCHFDNGKVTLPEALRAPFKQFVEGGWLALSHSPEYGGQGAPELIRKAVDDMFFGACITLNLGLLLTPGAAHLIEAFGSDELKKIYCERMYSGEWSGTMCLTEASAGSDVGASKTKATRVDGEDYFLIEGEKIFITFGEHDLTDNIVHAVLARIEGAPAGTKGLSLFCVPKYLVNDDGSIGDDNNVACSGIEHKLGINASPTCTMVFGSAGPCRGWLIGQENAGMPAMFQMMNEARIAVGLQGVALGNAAYLNALRYSQERLQGAHFTQLKNADAPRTAIIEHPDVRMMLLRQKAYGEGCRSLLLFSAYCLDRSTSASDAAEREYYGNVAEYLTPICKAYCSDMGFRMTEWALQCYGGYGYLKDYPAEQYLRDCKIASLYEGTNGIQALDLIGRKMTAKGGAFLLATMKLVSSLIEKHSANAAVTEPIAAIKRGFGTWGEINGFFAACAGKQEYVTPMLSATSYLSLTGDLLVAALLTDQAAIAATKLAELCRREGVDASDGKAVRALAKKNAEAAYLDGKVKTARFFCANELPQLHAKAEAIRAADKSAMEIIWPDLTQ